MPSENPVRRLAATVPALLARLLGTSGSIRRSNDVDIGAARSDKARSEADPRTGAARSSRLHRRRLRRDEEGRRHRWRAGRSLRASVTIKNVKTGTLVACKGWRGQGARVPPRGQALIGFASEIAIPGKKSPALDQMSLRHGQNGSITVTCKASH